MRLVELPVGASTDRLAGTLDIERALSEGVKAFEPGLLAAAHRGILYVDEVNLLSDHLVDLLLDVAAMGVNHVEREGVSVRHPARFMLVGTMNSEEGELRPQLLDRFGLSVEVTGSPEPAERVEIVRRRLHYEAGPEDFAAKWSAADAGLAASVADARERLAATHLSDGILYKISTLCADLGVDGLRGDLVTAKTSRTLAARDGRDEVTVDDVRRAALLALSHRRRRGPFEPPGMDPEELEESLSEESDPPDGPDEIPEDASQGSENHDKSETSSQAKPRGESQDERQDERRGSGEKKHGAGEMFDPVRLEVPGRGEGGPLGRRSRSTGREGEGHPVGDRVPEGEVRGRGARGYPAGGGPRQRERGWSPGTAGFAVRPEDVREKVREAREGNLILFLVDASGSMAAKQRMSAVKGSCALAPLRHLPAPGQGRPRLCPGRGKRKCSCRRLPASSWRPPDLRSFRPVAAPRSPPDSWRRVIYWRGRGSRTTAAARWSSC